MIGRPQHFIMSQQVAPGETVELEVENIGGIDETTVEFSPGVTILTGRNATNRTSLIQAIMAVLGSEHASLKGDADQGRIELTVGETTYTRTLHRENGSIVRRSRISSRFCWKPTTPGKP
jgi:DNA repair ATPase RecN